MAAITYTDNLTVLEQAQTIGPDGGILPIAEILNEENEIMMDATAKRANGLRANVTAVRTDLPEISIRKINSGASTTYPQTKQVEDQIMLLEAWPEIDEQLVDPYPDPRRARGQQLRAYVEAFSQAFTNNLIYGNRGDIGEIDGWATTYNTLSLDNVIGAGGTGSDVTSLWMAEWDPMMLTLIYPKDSNSVGLFNKDWGKKRVTDTSGNPFAAYVSQMKMEFGWSQPEPRSLVRVANIETAGTSNNLVGTSGHHPLVQARNFLKKRGKGKTAIYCNRDLLYQFDIWAMDKANGFYYQDNISGGPLMTFQGIPIRLVEQIVDEAAIS
jgi:hypothetical protein